MKNKKKTALIICIVLLVVLIVGGIIAAVVIRNNVISKDEASSYAYEDAGVDSSSVVYVSVEFDYDYGQFIYDVEFIANQTEYEYVIKASDGSIIKKEIEGNYSGGNQNTAPTN